jgi:hypothetical protein
VYDDINDEWFYALSTNCVNYGYTITQMISRNGVAYNDSINSSDNWEDGNYFTAWEDADAAYLSGHSTKTTIMPPLVKTIF